MVRYIHSGKILLLCFWIACTLKTTAQNAIPRPFQTLGISEGLPQSFISGLVQDSVGFIWIATRDGLARYDGRKFKLFMHKQGDSTTLVNNTIENIYLDKRNQLWIVYETGDIDVLHTSTEKLFHFSKHPIYGVLTGLVKPGHSIAEDDEGNYWFLSTNGGVFIYNPDNAYMRFISEQKLGLSSNKITGITPYLKQVALMTDTALLIINAEQMVVDTKSYKYSFGTLYDTTMPWKDNYSVPTKNGSLIIKDIHRLLVYNAPSNQFLVVPPPQIYRHDDYLITRDEMGQVIIVYPNDVYLLSENYKLVHLQGLAQQTELGFISTLVDRSGILWLGGNGIGVQLHDLRPSGLSGILSNKDYHLDLMEKFLYVSQSELKNSFLATMSSYFFRSLQSRDGKIWISKSTRESSATPGLLYYQNGHIRQPAWKYSDSSLADRSDINALAESRSGRLWGINFFMHPVFFDTSTNEATVYPSITKISHQHSSSSVISVVIDGEDLFWIVTAFDGLFRYNHKTREVRNYKAADSVNSLPSNQLTSLVQDPDKADILWIGTLGGGLIQFRKSDGNCRTFNMNDGLPNNTINAILLDKPGNLWCSTNRGIFSFNRENFTIRSFSSNDGLPCDEFNRYHYFQLPDKRLSFGGISGYTVFSPEQISDDTYNPRIALTGISINNQQKDFGFPGTPFNAAVNSLEAIRLPYSQNFLSFEMAALQYSIPEKIQYRYMLEGFDEKWVYAGANNIATYTNIPPGNYLLKVNATNTAGKWSTHIKTLPVTITPPFWKTAWFITISAMAAGALIYLFVFLRIKAVRKEEQQLANFERQAVSLKEQALRAQMNPHFIFNCLNSIKSLIQEDNRKQAVTYLTTFSRLIRNQLNNAQELVSLYAELETCRLYVQLEGLRFGDNVTCEFIVDESIDLYSLQVPPLIIQPFVENAIWHGILPKNGGNVIVSIVQQKQAIACIIDDNGIGRELSMTSKIEQSATYESKGMKLVQNRLNLYNTISRYGGQVEVVDKKDEHGKAMGTQIILTFKLEV